MHTPLHIKVLCNKFLGILECSNYLTYIWLKRWNASYFNSLSAYISCVPIWCKYSIYGCTCAWKTPNPGEEAAISKHGLLSTSHNKKTNGMLFYVHESFSSIDIMRENGSMHFVVMTSCYSYNDVSQCGSQSCSGEILIAYLKYFTAEKGSVIPDSH